MHPAGRNNPCGAKEQERDAEQFQFMEETMKNKNQLIGCCGLDCEKCDARIATFTNDNALREKTAARWTKLNGVTITPEMISCTGCRIEGAKTPFCDKLCPVHTCVRKKGLDTCADCGQMDGCPTLGQIAVNSPFVLKNLKALHNELFAGEFVCDENYKNIADKNLLSLLEHRLYDNSNSEEIGFDEFHNALEKMSEVALLLQRFKDRQEAITYLTNETGLPAEECASAYDIYMKIFECR